MGTSEGVAGSGSTGPAALDRRLEALIEAASVPATSSSAAADGPEPVAEGTIGEMAAELRAMRQAFLSLPPLDLLEERLTAIEVALDRLTEALTQVFARPDEAVAAPQAPLRGTGG